MMTQELAFIIYRMPILAHLNSYDEQDYNKLHLPEKPTKLQPMLLMMKDCKQYLYRWLALILRREKPLGDLNSYNLQDYQA